MTKRLLLPTLLLLAATTPLRADAPPDADATTTPLQEPVGDSRTMGRFAANLGRNLVGVVSGDNLKPFLLGAGISVSGSFLDASTQRYFAGQHRADSLGRIGADFGKASFVLPATGALFVAGRASHNARFRAASYDLAQAFLTDLTWTSALKVATQRERPDASSSLSFPSGHTSLAFAWATVAGHHYGPKVGIAAFAAAGLVGVSRLETNAHHLSDVLAGATLGYIVGRTTVREDGQPLHERHHLSLGPSFAPSGRGVGVGMSLEF